ncbi:hypothetical protein SAMN05421753_117115 [Planctomicrobium piriforme]|uniref:Uncharacterized protein n=1 Tax=Planctomicrobium piriforme TaxID=1576369 RepID=A0A1I3Q2S2_9PLAN|nr:hypothetical protein SAMN05421753_117115 [Planctomicrobium piriforme]
MSVPIKAYSRRGLAFLTVVPGGCPLFLSKNKRNFSDTTMMPTTMSV